MSAEPREFSPGEVIFLEGDAGDCMYSVESGTVEISTGYGTPSYKPLTTLEEGAFFGEMGMVRGFPRSATAVAGVHGAVVRRITWETLSVYFKEKPSTIVLMMQQLSRRVAELTDDYIGACGEIARLLEERAVMEERLTSLEGARAAAGTGSAADAETAGSGETAGSAETAPMRKNEDPQLKKYVDAYRRYASVNRAFSVDEEGKLGFYI